MKLNALFEERDPDWDYDERRQQQLDEEVDKHLVTRHVVRVNNETVAGPFPDSKQAVSARDELNKKHPKAPGDHREYASVYTYRTKPEAK